MKPTSQIRGYLSAIAVFTGTVLPMNVWAFSGAMIEEVEASAANKVLPKVVTQTAPIYPNSLMRSGTEGIVIVMFTVDEDGNVRDAEVASSPARALNPYAVKTVGNWKFSPGLKDGKKATFRLKAGVEFKVDGKKDTAEVALAAPANQPIALPARAQAAYDVAPAAKRKVAPFYPLEMLLAGRSGWAEANFVVDFAGRPLLANTAGASDSPFAKAVIAMVEASEFTPAKKDKHPVMSPSSERITFGGEESLDPTARRILAELRKDNPSLRSVQELDEKPKAVVQKAPTYPRALRDDGLTGQAEIEFVVDKDGRVLFPHIVSASHEDFGWAAATAVAQWKYSPPQKNGERVEVRMKTQVLFDARQLAAAD